jgi:hypothetical protein
VVNPIVSRKSPTKPPAAVPPATPAWQTIATVLIILHLFALGIGLASGVAGGKSLLAPALYRVPAVATYLKLLWMNVPYDFHIASPLAEDGTHQLELTADPASPQPSSVELPAFLPTDEIEPRIRRKRYQDLVANVVLLDQLYAELADRRTELPLAMAERWLRDLKAPHEPFVLTCISTPAARLPKAVERAPALKVKEGGPKTDGPAVFEAERFQVYLVWDPDSQAYQGARSVPEGEAAQVIRNAATESSPGEPASAGGPASPTTPIETTPPAINPGDAQDESE